MKERRPAHQTQWTAQFAVASELCKRGYQVALTLGNHPTVDLMVRSPNGESFYVDVKGQYRENFWPVKSKEKRTDLFYILAFVPDPGKGENLFSILTQDEATIATALTTTRWRERKPERANKIDPMPCVTPAYARQHVDRWDKLPK